MYDTYFASFASLELRQISVYVLIDRDLAALDEHHNRGRGHWLSDRSDDENRIGFSCPRSRLWRMTSEALVKHNRSAAGNKNRSRAETSVAYLRFQHVADAIDP